MIKLYFLRHGIAEDRAGWRGDDVERPLTVDGRKRMEREAAAIAGFDLGLDAIITSPLKRARQTASIVAEALKAGEKLLTDGRLGVAFDKDRLEEILLDHPGAAALMLVGHEPSFSETIGSLIGGGRVVCKKGGLACVRVYETAPPKGELLWLIPPRLLAP
jgi:phosphohistidine phosphatase